MLDFEPLAPTEILLAQRAIADTAETATLETTPAPGDSPATTGTGEPAGVVPHKSPGRAFIYNIVLPGAGHLYAGSKRGWAHIGMEGLAWATRFYYQERGSSKEDEFEAHAEEHWDYTRWINSCQCTGSPEDSLIVYFRENNKQHFYEDIVKLNTYAQGWDDASNRNFNRGMRQDSNNFLKNARYAVVGAFVNRIVSAVDALRMLKSRSRNALGHDTNLRLRLRTKPFANETAFGFEIRKQL